MLELLAKIPAASERDELFQAAANIEPPVIEIIWPAASCEEAVANSNDRLFYEYFFRHYADKREGALRRQHDGGGAAESG